MTAAVLMLVSACDSSSPRAAATFPPSPTQIAQASASASPIVAFSVARVMTDVRRLAAFGPREATSASYRRAAGLVVERFDSLGYETRRQSFRVPRGVSWGVPVPAGDAQNVIAEPRGFDRHRPHLLVGAHLDTVPQAPGANDNASGVAIVLELARLAAANETSLPVVFVAFGAEEPRGPGDPGHHFGSRHYARRALAERHALLGVVSIDRVGYGSRLLVCSGGRGPTALRALLSRAAARIDVPSRTCINRTSDHWPFELLGFTGARLDGGRFPGYHSRGDVVARVDERQLARAARTAWETLQRLRARDLSS